MTDKELLKLYELKGRLQGRTICLESDIRATSDLITRLETEVYQAHYTGRLSTLKEWEHSNESILNEVSRIIKETENDRK